jgi:hypothetical protein
MTTSSWFRHGAPWDKTKTTCRAFLIPLQFTSETLGPSVVFFGSANGKDADTVPVARSNDKVGPLAARLDSLLDEVERKGLSLSPRDFVDSMQIAALSSPFDNGVQVRGYTALRNDFKAALPQGMLFSLAHSDP